MTWITAISQRRARAWWRYASSRTKARFPPTGTALILRRKPLIPGAVRMFMSLPAIIAAIMISPPTAKMKKKTMMTSPIGNDLRKNSKRGFSFLEVMVAVMVLSGGLISIYKSFFTSLDYTNHLTIRLQANILLDEKIATLNRLLQ